MIDRILNYYDINGSCKQLRGIDSKLLFEYDGNFVYLNFEYTIFEDEQGFVLVLVDKEQGFAWADSIFETKEELESRVIYIRENLEKMSSLDEELSLTRRKS